MASRKQQDMNQIYGAAAAGAIAISEQDQAAAAAAAERRGQRSTLPLTEIQPRAIDTRPLNQKHVTALVESIAALGLIEPLVVDQRSVLLAGGHRLAAIQQLQVSRPEKFAEHFGAGVPVRMMPFDAAQTPDQALAVELAENEKRVNYTRDQIERLAERLKALNYRDTPGRPAKGEKALAPAIAVAIGVSTRHVRRILSDEQPQRRSSRNIRTSCPNFLQRQQALQSLEKSLAALIALPADNSPTAHQEINELSTELRVKIQAVLAEDQDKVDLLPASSADCS